MLLLGQACEILYPLLDYLGKYMNIEILEKTLAFQVYFYGFEKGVNFT